MRVALYVLAALAAPALSLADVSVSLGTATLVLSGTGRVGALTTRAGVPLAVPGNEPAFSVETPGGVLAPISIERDGGTLHVRFATGAASFTIAEHNGFALFELRELTVPEVRRFTLFRLRTPATPKRAAWLNASFHGPDVVAVMSAEVNVRGFMAGSDLIVESYARYGLRPARFLVAVMPEAELESTIERMEAAAHLPSPRIDGVWAKRSPAIKRSYLFLTNFTEADLETGIAIAKRGRFDAVLLLQSSWCKSTGHFEINEKSFPTGLAGLQRFVKRFQSEGFRVGLHFLGASIYPPDRYLTPKPDPRLVKDARTTLASGVDAQATTITVSAMPGKFPTADGGYDGAGAVLQIDDELILYTSRTNTAPWEFRGCKRGYLGTTPAPHAKDANAAHVLKAYGYFLYDMDTTLVDEVAANFAAVANACGADMIYFDGAERLQGDHWYYNARLVKAFHDRLQNKNTLLQASSVSHYSWHMLSRYASADGHGDLKGYFEERSPSFPSREWNRMPLDIGWYYGYDKEATIDQFEYILGATLGYDASMSYQVSPSAYASHPIGGEIVDLIAKYETLRLSGRVPAKVRELFRVDAALGGKKTPEERDKLLAHRRDYRLKDDTFQRVVYEPWRKLEAPTEWTITVPEGGARVGVQLHALSGAWHAAGPSYRGGVMLEAFDDLAPYRNARGSAGVTASITPCPQAKEGGGCALFTATSGSDAASGWAVAGKSFATPLDLSNVRGFGLWLAGDGNGGQFKLQLTSAQGALDYYIANNYRGWRYHQLERPAKDPIDFAKVTRVLFYYNGLPANSTVACAIDDVRALNALDTRGAGNVVVRAGAHTWRKPGALRENEWWIVWPGEGGAPDATLPAGTHTVRLEMDTASTAALNVRLTLQPPERIKLPLR